MSVSTILLVAIIAFLALKGLIGDSGHQMHYPGGFPPQPQAPRFITTAGSFLIGIICIWLLFNVFTGGNWSELFPSLPEAQHGENSIPANLTDKPTKINKPPRETSPPESVSGESGRKTLVNQPPPTKPLKKIVLLTRNATPEQATTLQRSFLSHDISYEVSADNELLVYIQYYSKEEGKRIYQQWKDDTQTCDRFQLNPQLMDLIY